MFFVFVEHALPIVGVGGMGNHMRDIGPELRIFMVDLDPFLGAGLAVGEDGLGRTFRFTNSAVDAFVGVDDEHVLALVETIHRTYFDAISVFALDTKVIDKIGHFLLFKPLDLRPVLEQKQVACNTDKFGSWPRDSRC